MQGQSAAPGGSKALHLLLQQPPSQRLTHDALDCQYLPPQPPPYLASCAVASPRGSSLAISITNIPKTTLLLPAASRTPLHSSRAIGADLLLSFLHLLLHFIPDWIKPPSLERLRHFEQREELFFVFDRETAALHTS